MSSCSDVMLMEKLEESIVGFAEEVRPVGDFFAIVDHDAANPSLVSGVVVFGGSDLARLDLVNQIDDGDVHGGIRLRGTDGISGISGIRVSP